MSLEQFFHLKENNTKISTEILAGITSFCATAYVIMVIPDILQDTGIPSSAVYLAIIITCFLSSLIVGLIANVPFVMSAGLGLSSFFAYTVVDTLGFTWQESLAIVFLSGILGMIVTLTKIRIWLVEAIPASLRASIGCGLGLFIIYVGLLKGKIIAFNSDIAYSIPHGSPPAFNFKEMAVNPEIWLFVITILLLIFLTQKRVKGAILISIAAATLLGLFPVFGCTTLDTSLNMGAAFAELPRVAGAAFTEGLPGLMSSPFKLLCAGAVVCTFSLITIFDMIGTTIGVGHDMALFNDREIERMKNGRRFETRIERVLASSSLTVPIGAIIGAPGIVPCVESACGIESGGRTGLTSVAAALCFALCIFLIPLAQIVPSAATAPVLVLVGIMMLKTFGSIVWDRIETAIPCFFMSVFMALAYSITDGIAMGILCSTLITIVTGKKKEISPLMWVVSGMFAVYFLVMIIIRIQ